MAWAEAMIAHAAATAAGLPLMKHRAIAAAVDAGPAAAGDKVQNLGSEPAGRGQAAARPRISDETCELRLAKNAISFSG